MISLKPFTRTTQTQQIEIQVLAHENSPTLWTFDFYFSGKLDAIQWPPLHSSVRKDLLWQHTCLEAFFSLNNMPESYHELNCSPSSEWNLYSFSSYRKDMQPSEAFTVKLVSRTIESQQAHFQIQLSSDTAFKVEKLGISAVIEFRDGTSTFWAVHHPRSDADFHDQKGWTALSTR